MAVDGLKPLSVRAVVETCCEMGVKLFLYADVEALVAAGAT